MRGPSFFDGPARKAPLGTVQKETAVEGILGCLSWPSPAMAGQALSRAAPGRRQPKAFPSGSGPRPLKWCMRNHLAICPYLSGNCLNCPSSLACNIFFVADIGGLAAGSEYFRSHIAALFGPFVALLVRRDKA